MKIEKAVFDRSFMRQPRLQFTVRRMMIAVVVVAILCGVAADLWRRHVSFKRQSDEYAEKANDEFVKGYLIDHRSRFISEPEIRERDEHYRLMEYYDELKVKYERASGRPWLPVASDRPPPEQPKSVLRVDDIMRPEHVRYCLR